MTTFPPLRRLRRPVALLAATVVCLSAWGCGNLLGPGNSAELVAAWDDDEIVLENIGTRTIFYFAITAEMAPLVVWMPCVDLDSCRHVHAGESARLGPQEVFGLEETSEVLLYWWVAVREGGERRPGRIHRINLPR